MRISFGIIVIDGMPFIRHQLELLYPHAHEILICEGGDDTWEELHGYRHSKDATIDVIKTFPDPLNKIQLIQKKWKDKNHMCHEYSKKITGDIVWHVDVDEFLDPDHIPYLVSLFEKFPEYDAMAPPQIVFWGDTRTILGVQNLEEESSDPEYLFELPNIDRIYRHRKDLYVHHLPVRGYYDPSTGKIIPGKKFPQSLLIEKDVYNYHFSYVLPKTVADKMSYYNERTPGSAMPGWYKNVFMKFKENREEWIKTRFNVQSISPETKYDLPYRIKALDRPLPECLKRLEKDITRYLKKASNTQ